MAILATAPLYPIWNERVAPEVGPAGMSLLVTNRQVILRYQGGEAAARTVAFWIRPNAPFGEMADLTNAILIDRVRTAAGSTTFVPDDNGVYYAAAMVYVSFQDGRQNYALIPAPEEATVDWVPPRMPVFPMLPMPVLETNVVSMPATPPASNPVATRSETNNVKPVAESNGSTNAVAETKGTNASNAAASWAIPVTNAPVTPQVVVHFPTNAFYPPWMQGLNPAMFQGDRMGLSAKEFLSALTNLMAERQRQDAPKPLRDQYFSQVPDAQDLQDLAAVSRELHDLWGDLLRHRRDGLPLGETDIYPLLLRYGNATVLLEGAYVRVMEKGIQLTEVERLRSDFAALQRELLSLWKRVEERLKSGITGP